MDVFHYFFFFKQKTAYEMRISDWSSDVFSSDLAEKDAELIAVNSNPVDAVWPDRPAPSKAKLIVHPQSYAGRSSTDKRREIADWLISKKADAVVLPALDSIAWTLNVRGQDVDRTPVALAYAIIHADATADLYVAPEKLADDVVAHLGNAVRVHDRADFASDPASFAGKRIAADPDRAGDGRAEGWERVCKSV